MTYPPRCLRCGYVLIGLPEGRCPECGRFFDPENPTTYSSKPLFVWWKYWLPGFAFASVGGAVLFVLLITLYGFGLAVTVVAPFCLGAVVGYGCRVRGFLKVILALAALFVVIATLMSLSILGMFCAIVFASVALSPLLFGMACAVLLRLRLKASHFEQRWHLPVLMLVVAPSLVATIERLAWRPYPVESVVTSVVVDAPAGRAWKAVMFYEEVKHRPPWLLRIGLPRPLYTRGRSEHVGDAKVCVYSKGRLGKRVTELVQNRRLAFDVVVQDRIETRSIRLTDGSFDFVALGPDRTRIDLTTRYEPKLGPRWIWRTAERMAVHALHGHVLEGMRQKATEP